MKEKLEDLKIWLRVSLTNVLFNLVQKLNHKNDYLVNALNELNYSDGKESCQICYKLVRYSRLQPLPEGPHRVCPSCREQRGWTAEKLDDYWLQAQVERLERRVEAAGIGSIDPSWRR